MTRVRLAGLATAVAVILAAGRAAYAVEPTAGYLTIQRAFLQEDFPRVATLAQSFLTQVPGAPERPRVWLWLALSLDRLNQTPDALRELDQLKAQLLSDDPVWAEVLYWEGDISQRANQLVRSRMAYQRLIEKYPQTTWANQAQLGMGLIHLHQQSYDQAIGYLHEVALRQPGTGAALDARLFEGLCHLQLKQYPEAIALLEPLVRELQAPNAIAQAAVYLGESYTGLQRYEDAIGAYQRATASATSARWTQPAWFGLGWASYQANRCEDSVNAFEEYLRSRTGDHRIEALYAQGGCLLKLEREPEALERFERIVNEYPTHALAVDSGLVLADAYRREGKLEQAKSLLHEFLRRQLAPAAHTQVQLRLGSVALDMGNITQAKTIFTLAAESEELPVRQAALNGLGDLAMYQGDASAAATFYAEAVKVQADTPLEHYASFQLARIHLQAGALDEAVAEFRRLSLLEGSGLSDDAKLSLIIAYLNQREETLARAQVDEIRAKHPGSVIASRAAYYQALLALGQEDDALAKQLCEEVIKEAPHTDEAIEARLLLADLQVRAGTAEDVIEWLSRAYHQDALSRSQRAKLAKRLGDLSRSELVCEDAMEWYERAADLQPSMESEAVYRMASCFEEAGDHEIAMRWYRKIDRNPWRVRAQLALAKLLERQERLDEASNIYRELAKQPIPEAPMIQERLTEIQAQRLNKKER